MAHRFPIGTTYTTTKKVGRKFIKTEHVVTEQLTVIDSKGRIVREYYTASHEFCGQAVADNDVVATTIARGCGLLL